MADQNPAASVVTTEWLESILSSHFSQKIVVHEFEHSPGLEKGENYISITARIRVVFSRSTSNHEAEDTHEGQEREVLRLFAKFIPVSEGQRQFTVKYNMFEREAVAYNDLLPAIGNFCDRNSEEDSPAEKPILFDCHPKVFKADKDVILMEDLSYNGFKMADRRTGLTMNEMTVALKAIARFHGLTYALLRSEPNTTPQEYTKSHFQFLSEDIYEFASFRALWADAPAAMRMVEAVKKHSPSILEEDNVLDLFKDKSDMEDVVARLEAYAAQDIATKVEAVLMASSETDCFLLGDTWVNNMMFRYSESEDGQPTPAEICLLDFQLVRFSRPLIEIAFFIYTSANRESFEEHSTLLRIYYDEFLSTIEHLPRAGSQKPLLTRDSYPFEKMVEEYQKCEEAGFMVSLSWAPMMILTKEDFPENFGEEGEFGDYMGDLLEQGLAGPAGRNVVVRFLDHARRARSIGII